MNQAIMNNLIANNPVTPTLDGLSGLAGDRSRISQGQGPLLNLKDLGIQGKSRISIPTEGDTFKQPDLITPLTGAKPVTNLDLPGPKPSFPGGSPLPPPLLFPGGDPVRPRKKEDMVSLEGGKGIKSKEERVKEFSDFLKKKKQTAEDSANAFVKELDKVKKIPPMKPLPFEGTFAAIKMDDGSVFIGDDKDPHVDILRKNKLPISKAKASGFVFNGVFENSPFSTDVEGLRQRFNNMPKK